MSGIDGDGPMSDELTKADLFLVQENVRLEQERTIAALESQNQALQEELATTQEAYRCKSREADANGRLAEDAVGAVEALQERAEKAEKERDDWIGLAGATRAAILNPEAPRDDIASVLESALRKFAASIPHPGD